MTRGLPRATVTRAPMDGGCNPSKARSTPARCKDSVYFNIAATAFASGIVPGLALSYPLGIINSMNRNADLTRRVTRGSRGGSPDAPYRYLVLKLRRISRAGGGGGRGGAAGGGGGE